MGAVRARTRAIAGAIILAVGLVGGAAAESPTYVVDTAPAGASAVCGDGTYSFAVNHSGACSHHAGVAYWIARTPAAPPTAPARPPPNVPSPACQFANGFLDFYAREPFLVGECVGAEFGTEAGSAQWTTHGLFVWSPRDGVGFSWQQASGRFVLTNGEGVWGMDTGNRLPGTLDDYRPSYWQR